ASPSPAARRPPSMSRRRGGPPSPARSPGTRRAWCWTTRGRSRRPRPRSRRRARAAPRGSPPAGGPAGSARPPAGRPRRAPGPPRPAAPPPRGAPRGDELGPLLASEVRVEGRRPWFLAAASLGLVGVAVSGAVAAGRGGLDRTDAYRAGGATTLLVVGLVV